MTKLCSTNLVRVVACALVQKHHMSNSWLHAQLLAKAYDAYGLVLKMHQIQSHSVYFQVCMPPDSLQNCHTLSNIAKYAIFFVKDMYTNKAMTLLLKILHPPLHSILTLGLGFALVLCITRISYSQWHLTNTQLDYALGFN